jgi:hypothetical protein
MGAFSRQIGQEYLQFCVGDVVRELVLDDSISFELDEKCVLPSFWVQRKRKFGLLTATFFWLI